MKGFLFAVFVLMSVIIVFLAFQLNDNSQRCTSVKASDQELITKATKLMISSGQQNHPVISFETALESKMLLDEILHRYGNVTTTEKQLKLEPNQLKQLKEKIYSQYQASLHILMQQEIKKNPSLDIPENELAQLTQKSKRRHKSSKR
jgi:hypothetical protein